MAKKKFTQTLNGLGELGNLNNQPDEQTGTPAQATAEFLQDNAASTPSQIPPAPPASSEEKQESLTTSANTPKHPKGKNTPKKQNPRNKHRNNPDLPVKQYQSMSILKRLAYKGKVRDYDAVALALLARNLKKQHPEMSAEDILQNQIEFYLAIQKEAAKSARALGDSEKRAEAIKHLQDFSKKKSDELVKTPVTQAINETIDDIYDYVYDFHMKWPDGLSQKKYSEKLNCVPEGLERGKTADNVSFSTPGFKENQSFLHLALNVDPEPGLFDELVTFAEKYPCLYIAPKNLRDAYSKPDSLHIWILPDNQDEAQRLLQEIAKKYHRNRGDDVVIGKKIADGLFYAEENPKEYAKSVLTEMFNKTTTQLNTIFENEKEREEKNRRHREEEKKRKEEERKQRETERQQKEEKKEEEKRKPKEAPKKTTIDVGELSPVSLQAINANNKPEPEPKPEPQPNPEPEPESESKPKSNPKPELESKPKRNNFGIIDIGTNAAKCDLFFGDREKPFEALRNESINIADEDSVVDAVEKLFNQATKGKGIEPKRMFIVATEGLRASPNSENIIRKINAKINRQVHIISPEREAYYAILGGLNAIPDRKNLPQYVLFIESGGGSTEISLVNTQKPGIPVISTISLPLGSKKHLIDNDSEKTQKLVTDKIKEFKDKITQKGINLSSLGVVINSGTASRILWNKNHNDGEAYNTKQVTKKLYNMSFADFSNEVKTLLDDLKTDEQKVKTQFNLSDGHMSGFAGHAYVLDYIMSELSNQFSDDIKQCNVLSTYGGLKDGAIQKIAYLDEKNKSPEEIEQDMFGKESEENKESKKETPSKPILAAANSDNNEATIQDNDNNYKSYWREYARNMATKLNGTMEEDKDAQNFEAKVTTNNDITFISASSKHNVSLGAQKKDGSATVPDQKFFDELALKAKDCGINFGNIKTPEFKARLMIACLKNNIIMIGQPKLDEEFLNSLDAEGKSAKYLKAWQNKQNTQQQQQTQPTPMPTATPQQPSQKNYEKTRDERERFLDTKSKTSQGFTPQEQHELDYIRFTKERKQALEEAIARTRDKNNPRTTEHTNESGYAPEDYAFFPNAREWNGWKLHLDVVPNRNEPTTKAVSEFLEKMQVDHKIANGGENGKGMTIYIGSYDDANKLAQEINSRFGKNIAEPPLYTDQKKQEIDLNKKVTGRFFLQDIYYDQYPEGAIKGLCNAEPFGLPMRRYLANLAIEDKIVNSDKFMHKIYAWERNDFHDQYIFDLLGSYCSHKLYQKHLGEYYCGKDADKFEQQIFGDALPPKGSKDRATWDKIADLYIQKSENDYPHGIQAMSNLKSKYTPIDFTKVPPLVRLQKSNTGNQP